MRRLLRLICLAALVLPAGAAAQDTIHKAPKIKRNPDLISEQEIRAATDAWQTASALVQNLRPMWLSQRGATSINLPTVVVQVYVGGIRRGGPESLEDVPRVSIKEIQHLRGIDASNRYGMGHESGAILVVLR